MEIRSVRALFFVVVLLIITAAASADELARPVAYPAIPAAAADPAGFTPAGWAVDMESRGDLNGDGAADLLLVLRMTDPQNVVREDGVVDRELDTNPQMLLVAFADLAKKAYSLALADHALIPRHTNPNMEPPLESAAIVKGTVQVSLHLFMTAGGWYTSNTKFTFRYQDGCFKLIGYDSRALKRNTGAMESVSINYLTKKAKVTKGDLEDEETEASWKPLRRPDLLCLEAIGDGLDFEPEHRPFP